MRNMTEKLRGAFFACILIFPMELLKMTYSSNV